jgi:hypothetical protein
MSFEKPDFKSAASASSAIPAWKVEKTLQAVLMQAVSAWKT